MATTKATLLGHRSATSFSDLTLSGDLTVNGTTTTLDTAVQNVDKLEIGASSTDYGAKINQASTGHILQLQDGGTDVMVVKDGGKVGIGTTPSVAKLQIQNSNDNSDWPLATYNDNGNVGFYVTQSASGDQQLKVNNNSGTTNVQLNSNGDSYLNGGNVGIGTSTPAVRLTALGPSEGSPASTGTTQTHAAARFFYGGGGLDIGNLSDGSVWIQGLNPTDLSVTRKIVMQLNGGNVCFGTTNESPAEGTTEGVRIGNNGGCQFSQNSNAPLTVNRYENIGTIVVFNYAGSEKGNIYVSTTATAYNTSSDYRLKENVTPLTGAIQRLNQLKPSRFNFIIEPNKTVDGFLAHEVSDHVPEAISGDKDAVNEDGSNSYQGIDNSKLVPLLVASVQELSAKVTALENA